MNKFKTIKMRDYRKNLFENWPSDWPSQEHHVIQHDVTSQQYDALSELIERQAGETEIERFLADNREVLSMVVWMFSTGHHMSWLYPKLEIQSAAGRAGGLIPDYLLAGANSDGLSWFVLELKGADKKAFVRTGKRVYLSSDANKGVCQLMNYMDHCAKDQAYLRDNLRLTGLREPKGVLLIGTDRETEDPLIRDFKRVWNDYNPRITIRSYNSLCRKVAEKLTI